MRLTWILLPLAPAAFLCWPTEDLTQRRLLPRIRAVAPECAQRVPLEAPARADARATQRSVPTEEATGDPLAARRARTLDDERLREVPVTIDQGDLLAIKITHLELTSVIAWEPKATTDGLVETHHGNGALTLRGHMEAGRRVGSWSEWHANGALAARGDYVYGEQHGPWQRWHPDGALAEDGSFVYGQREGGWTAWRADGSRLREMTYVNGQADGLGLSFHADGAPQTRTTYRYGEAHGPQVTWHANGRLACRGEWHDGVQSGHWRFWDEGGTPNLDESGWYEAGQRVTD